MPIDRVRVLLFANIRLGQKLIEVTNTLAYHDSNLITSVKGFIVWTPGPVS
jgi:hypothetical protein